MDRSRIGEDVVVVVVAGDAGATLLELPEAISPAAAAAVAAAVVGPTEDDVPNVVAGSDNIADTASAATSDNEIFSDLEEDDVDVESDEGIGNSPFIFLLLLPPVGWC